MPSADSKDKKKVFEFSDEEFNLLNNTNKELNIDNETYDDLKSLPENKPDLSDKEIDKLIKDPKVKTTVTAPGQTPFLENTLGPMDRTERVTEEQLKLRREQNKQERRDLIETLAAGDSINLDIRIGTKDGNPIYVQKEFFFKPIDKREEFQLKMKAARVSTIQHRYLGLTRPNKANNWTDDEFDFVTLAPAMLEVAQYQFSEFEAFMRLGMSADDFARVSTDQYNLAIEVMTERVANPSSSKRGQSRSGSGGASGRN